MSDIDSKDMAEPKKAAGDKAVGEGERSLSNWQRLAAARQDGSDPRAALAQYGVQASSLGGNAALASLEKRLAFAGEVERDTLGIHRGAALVVGPVALAVAGVAAAAGAAVVAAAAAGNVAYVVNAAQTANVAWTANWVSGDKVVEPLPAGDTPGDWWDNVWGS